jgi:curved DNA-binding protein CbpA
MGNGVSSLDIFDPAHVRIYKSLLQIQNQRTRVGMIQTLLAGPEYVQSARQAGIYSHMLAYVARVNAGEKPAPLPGEVELQRFASGTNEIVQHRPQAASNPSAFVAKGRSNEKAMTYFQNCLLVLELEEEVALTEDALRTAYKKAALKAHPDKGGSEQKFEAVTRSYAYLTEILRRIQGGRTKASVVEAPEVLKDSRSGDSKNWEMVQPVRLNPNKLDMNAFNQMFEQTRMPDPDDEGYGDWLKDAGGGESSAPKFSGKFNRDIFNSAFDEEARKRPVNNTSLARTVPQAMTLAPTHGVELGRSAAGDYTAAANAQMKFTDLRQAYTTENTFSNQVADVRVENRSFDTFAANRKKTPDPLTHSEMEAIQEAEAYAQRREQQRSVRAAQELVQSDEYFKRMKQLVLTDSPAKKSDRYSR